MADKILHQVIRYAAGIGESNFNEPGDIVHKGYVDSRLPQKWRATATAATATLNLTLPQALPIGLYKITVFVRNAINAARTIQARFNNNSGNVYLRAGTAANYYELFNGTIASLDSGFAQSLFLINDQNMVKGQIGQVVRGTGVNSAAATAVQAWGTAIGANVGAVISVQLFNTSADNAIGADSFVEIERIG
ncbi:hypothetical protein [Rhodoflexus caldus]|uniref:hypothetical protein n=1 Tax=Rhodoflexus caldus TaxID=2891236 RepID=UPI002029B63D|nr:hypothetical protein [Rhodoflexus caldus]